MILHSCLAALGFVLSTVAGAESTGNSLPDDTLQRYLAQSKFCITGHFISVRSEVSAEQGVTRYLCDVQVLETIKSNLKASKIRLALTRRFEYEAQLKRVDGAGKYHLTCEAWNLRGIYCLSDGRLTIVQPENERLVGLVWEIKNKNVLLLTVHPEGSQVGSDYRNATLSRFKGASISDQARGLSQAR